LANEIRFAVGKSRDDLGSSVWRLWAQGDELYLGARSHVGKIKISFHKSGINRVAPVSTMPRASIFQWKRKADIAPGRNQLLALIVPPLITKLPFRDRIPSNKAITLVMPSGPRKKVTFWILLSPPDTTEESVRSRDHSQPINLVGCVKPKSSTAWLLWIYDAYSSDERGSMKARFQRLKQTYPAGTKLRDVESKMMSAHFFQDSPVASQVIIDIVLGQENIVFENRRD
jgi:hypothetical protein